ncbi:MAG: prolipoprotein diacylglyceryl transferase [Clostridiales bacterium]|jgi:phosphatidylglycerol:prolipoprotein diacylglycerol transferase|nr:prolipoprotein diacylglyceryl transferase [Clostridiales bacterium]
MGRRAALRHSGLCAAFFLSMYNSFFGISTYTLLVAVGIAALFLTVVLIALNRLRVPAGEVGNILFLMAAGLGIGYFFSALFDAVFKIPENSGFKWSGITFYGGLIGGLLGFVAGYLLLKKPLKLKTPLTTWLNLLALSIPLAHCLGRIGCFLGGCCYGRPTDGPFGVLFPQNSPAYFEYGPGVKVFPTQLFEAAALLVLFAVFLFVKNEKFNRNRIYIYLVSYAVLRFALEFLRGDERGGLFVVLSPAQILSIALALFVIVALTVKEARRRRGGGEGKKELKIEN